MIRRLLLGGGLWGGVLGTLAALPAIRSTHAQHASTAHPSAGAQDKMAAHASHGGMTTVGEVDDARNGFDPHAILTAWDTGTVHQEADGRTVRHYTIVAEDREIEIAPGLFFPAWTYNGQTPGPTIRATEGDRVKVTFRNLGSHPHTIHFHGWHPPEVDGALPGQEVQPGDTFVYEFDAEPFGLHLYHCHTVPLKRHIHKGLYGAFIIDPREPRPPADELVMVMNAFDTNFDAENEFYAVNTVAFHYAKHPIAVALDELVRVYLVNITEFDPVNSFHLHAGMFNVFRTGTRLEPHDYTDLVTMGQGERHILEFTLKFPGQYMFHAHQSEFSELGWLGIFDVPENGAAAFAAPSLAGICDLSAPAGASA